MTLRGKGQLSLPPPKCEGAVLTGDERLWQEYGLTRLVPRTASFPWAKA